MSDDAASAATSDAAPARYVFSGYAVGAAVHCHTIYGEALKSAVYVPALGASVLPAIGGLSVSDVSHFCFEVPYPQGRTDLVSVNQITSRSEGITSATGYQTKIEANIDSITFIDKLHIDSASLYVLSERTILPDDPYVSQPEVTTRNRITGIHLGAATLQVDLDDDLLPSYPTATQIENDLDGAIAKGIQPYLGTYRFNLVKNLVVINQGLEKNKIDKIAPNAVSWEGFGNIFFGEVIVKNDDRQVTLVRIEMNADVGGSATVGDGHSNGSAGSS